MLHVACEVLQTWLYVATPHLLFSSWCCVSLRQMEFSHILLIARPMKLQVRKVLCKKTKNISHNNHRADDQSNELIRQYNKNMKVRLQERPSS